MSNTGVRAASMSRFKTFFVTDLCFYVPLDG
jgi:hypothetical protein